MGQSVPPKPEAVRRNARPGVVMLPASGRQGDPPPWPLWDTPPDVVKRVWRELWASPQAVAWEQHGWSRVVARYALVVIAAETLDKDALSEARQLEDRLGLTPKSMRMLMWQIAPDEVAEKRQETSAGARGRIKAVG